jgi:hypothetical protein
MAELIRGVLKLEETQGFTLESGERLLITIMPAGSTGTTGTVLYDGEAMEYSTVVGSYSIDADITSSAPYITKLKFDDLIIGPTATSTVRCTAGDPNDLTLTYGWTSDFGTISVVSDGVADWTAPDDVGIFTVTCTVTNTLAASTSASTSIRVHSVPEITSLTAGATSISAGATTSITCVATDPYTSDIFYVWGCTAGAIAGNTATNTWFAPSTPGTYTVTCKVYEYKDAAYDIEGVDIEVV